MKAWKIPSNSKFVVTQTFGNYDPVLNGYNWDKKHHGTDMVIADDIVYSASGSGVVIFAGWNNEGYGNLVMVQMDRFVFYYAHLKEIYVKRGDNVDYLTKIGVQGATGNVTGKHLHFEVRKDRSVIDSAQYMGIPNERGTFYPWDYAFDIGGDATHKYKTGELVVYSGYFDYSNSDDWIDCMKAYGAWRQDYIVEVINTKNPYKLANGTYLRDDCIKEVK